MKRQIQEDLTNALRARDEVQTGALRMLLSSLLNKEKEKRYRIWKENPELAEHELEEKARLSDEEVQEVVSTEVKKRREAAEGFEKGGREEMAQREKKEMEILQRYLPEQLSEEELRRLAREAVEKAGASTPQDMGRVMAELMPKVRGRADGSLAGKIVRELLGAR